MRNTISFTVFMGVKLFSSIFYKLDLKWLGGSKDFEGARLVIFLNHTSLYEPLFLRAAPNRFLWTLAQKMIAPAADKTLNRPVVGKFWKVMFPGLISITRKRDKSWFDFLKSIENKRIIIIAPEGRMKRRSGLDSHDKPMSVRSGVAEIISELNEGELIFAYSGGLHHVQHPGQLYPRLFKRIKLNLEKIDIPTYKNQFNSEGIQFRKDVVADLEMRIRNKCPS